MKILSSCSSPFPELSFCSSFAGGGSAEPSALASFLEGCFGRV